MNTYLIKYDGILDYAVIERRTLKEAQAYADSNLYQTGQAVRILKPDTEKEICRREFYGDGCGVRLSDFKHPIEMIPYGFWGDWVCGHEAADIPTKIKLAEGYAGMSETELARKLGTTPSALGQRIKTGKFSSGELDNIAAALGAQFVCVFRFADGTEI